MLNCLRRSAVAVATACVLLIPALASVAKADPIELIFNVFLPSRAPLFSRGLEPWAREVEAASNGAIVITIPTSSLAPPPRIFDIVQDEVADIAVVPMTFRRDQISLDMIGGIPQIAGSARGGSIALWETHQAFFQEADQWDDLVPLAMFTLGAPAILSNTLAVTSREDLAGFKMLAVGHDRIETWRNLGASPVGSAGNSAFMMVSGGVVDGVTNPLGTAVVQGLLDVSQHVTLVPGGMGGRATFALFMNRARFEALPQVAQEALITTSGTALSARLGEISDQIDASGLEQFIESEVDVETASAEFITEIRAATSFIEEAWLASAEEVGVDGPAALAHFRMIASANP